MEEMFVSLFIQENSNNIEKMNTYKEMDKKSIRDLTKELKFYNQHFLG